MVILGSRGSGKSVYLEHRILELDCAVLFLDRGTSGYRLLGHRSKKGKESHTWFQEATNVRKSLTWPQITASQISDPVMRQVLNDASIEDFVQGKFARRMLKDGSIAPYTYKFSVEAANVYLGCLHAGPTINYLRKSLAYGDRNGRWLLDNTTERGHADEIERVLALGPRKAEEIMGAAYRLLESDDSPVIWTRSGNSIDWEKMIQERQHLYFDLRDVPVSLARSLAVSAYTAAIHANKRLFAKHQKPHPLVIVCEEAGALDLITPPLLTSMQEDRKVGTSCWVVTQTPEDIKPKETFEALMALSDEQHIFRLNAGLDRAAEALMNKSFNGKEVHYVKERMEKTGKETEVRIKTRNKAHGKTLLGSTPGHKHNKTESETESEQIHFQPEVVKKEEEVYKAVPLQHQERKTKISNLPTFHHFAITREGVTEQVVYPMEYPWPFSTDRRGNETQTYRDRIQEIITRIQSRPQFITPQIWTPPPNSGVLPLPQNEPSSPSGSVQEPTPKTPRTRKASGGMRGS